MASRGGSFASYAANSSGYGHDATSDFMRLSQVISNNIHKINQSVAQMQSLLSQYCTPSDSIQVHDKLHEIQHYTNQLAKDTNGYIKELSHLPPPSIVSDQRQQKLQRERLVNEFTKALTNFQEAQRQEKIKEKLSNVKATHRNSSSSSDPFADTQATSFPPSYHDVSTEDGAAGGRGRQTMLQIDASDVDLEILREREEALRKLESDIMDVNQIFKDLGMLVYEQGDMVDSIEANVETAATSVEQGTEQLRQARKHQSSARKKKCIIITIILVILAILIIVLVSVYAPKT
jgi:t-SNARE complex subunit (syntaxin)